MVIFNRFGFSLGENNISQRRAGWPHDLQLFYWVGMKWLPHSSSTSPPFLVSTQPRGKQLISECPRQVLHCLCVPLCLCPWIPDPRWRLGASTSSAEMIIFILMEILRCTQREVLIDGRFPGWHSSRVGPDGPFWVVQKERTEEARWEKKHSGVEWREAEKNNVWGRGVRENER